MTENTIQTIRINRIKTECDGIKTLYFNIKKTLLSQPHLIPIPGQFVMIWVPGVDEIPMSISSVDEEGNWGMTVKEVGECTKAIHQLNEGDYIGIRGPLGNGFNIPEEKIHSIFLIGGGIGMAPIKWLSTVFHKKEQKYIIIEGAKTRDELVFVQDLHEMDNENSNMFYCTDDGSYGSKEFATDAFEKTLKEYSEEDISNCLAYTCGPEKMMYKVFQICENHNLFLQASLERIMRCGCGLCGLCAIDPKGLLVCKDGPVFNSDQLREMNDFGKYHRDFTGKKIQID